MKITAKKEQEFHFGFSRKLKNQLMSLTGDKILKLMKIIHENGHSAAMCLLINLSAILKVVQIKKREKIDKLDKM